MRRIENCDDLHDSYYRQFSPPPEKDSGKTALYVGGGLAALLLGTFAIPPARRAFLAAIKGLRNISPLPVLTLKGANSLEEIFQVLNRQLRTDKAFALVQSMRGDRFYRSGPVYSLRDMAPIRKILDRGVESFERKIYRTATNVRCWNNGYDCIAYEVKHSDGTLSLIRAFKYQESPFDAFGMGSVDMRKTCFDFGISEGNGTLARYLYRGSTSSPEFISYPYDEGLREVRDFIDSSVGKRGLVLLTRPDQIVVL